MVKFYILTSGHFNSLLRHNSPKYSNIPKEDMVVVINSLDEEYIKKAEKYCKDVGIEYHITESNGTPAKGKNSVLDLFLASDNDYCVMVDGDDFLTQYGVEYYKNIVNNKIIPDALCITNGLCLVEHMGKPTLSSLRAEGKKLFDPNKYFQNYMSEYNSSYEDALKSTNNLIKLHETQEKYSERHQTFTRVTWLSKKAAKFTFDEDLIIGEDAIQFFKLKHEAITNGLKFFTLDEYPATYIYDQRTIGTVRTETKEHFEQDWVDDFILKLDSMDKQNKLYEDKYLKEYRVFGQ